MSCGELGQNNLLCTKFSFIEICVISSLVLITLVDKEVKMIYVV